MKSIWNILTLLLLFATIGAVVVFGGIYLYPDQILLPGMRPEILPKAVIVETATPTQIVFPPTWTITPTQAIFTATHRASDTPMATNTIFVLPSATFTLTATETETPTITPTMTRTATSSGGVIAATMTPTKTKIVATVPTATPCPGDSCGIHAVDDEVTSGIYPSSVVANLVANDILNGHTVRITKMLNCADNCATDAKGRYTTKIGKGKVLIVSDTNIIYYPASGFMGVDKIDYKIQGSGGTTDIGKVVFIVTDGVQLPPDDITSNPSPLTVQENQGIGTLIGNFEATDPNGGPHRFYLVSGNGSTDNSYFGLSTGGVLRSAAVFNCESKSTHSIRVQAMDSKTFTREEVFSVTITDVNESTPTITSGASASGVEGNAFSFNITSSDADCDKTRTISMTGTLPAGLSFAAVAGNGTATISGSPDPGSSGTYTITLRVTDYGGLYSEKDLTITISVPTPTPTHTPSPTSTPEPPTATP